MTAHDKLVHYLEEAHSLEGALVQTLTAHIAMTPEGAYRDLLERHLQETREHARAIEERLGQLGAGRSPLASGLGVIENVIGQALALGKAPFDLVRGSGGEEKLLKNAKDEVTSEANEIATYDAIEALAEALGDKGTADLARRHREQEEQMLAGLRELIPSLTEAVLAADVLGIETYDVSETGAADAVRAAAREVRERAGAVADEARDAAGSARATARRATRGTGGGTASRSRSTGGGTGSRSTGAGTGSRSRSTGGGTSSRSRSTGGGTSRSRSTSGGGTSSRGGGGSSGNGGSSGGSGSTSGSSRSASGRSSRSTSRSGGSSGNGRASGGSRSTSGRSGSTSGSTTGSSS